LDLQAHDGLGDRGRAGAARAFPIAATLESLGLVAFVKDEAAIKPVWRARGRGGSRPPDDLF
jgi:hypothetical protein